ncbi:HK97-gp10 family putative phage morphogenesis protein [Turicibacter sanguinis]|uniref:HK97-gp10 family putative phage morphogenesis protein n=1 Tax=Turicibacter sanguinis TaxID=154288 RepID=UPI0021D4EBAC|nr:HK97-gp10 family putative phage morphogenesis protein [Turicibacter sanguinis]
MDFRSLRGRLDTISKKVAKKTLDTALEAGGEVLVESMKTTVPVDTGELRGSLGKIKIQGNNLERKILTGIATEDRDIIERGYYQEYGHSRMTGKKWMKAAERQSKVDAVKAVANSLSEQLKG